FNIIAWVVLPDHAHIVLDPMKSDIPKLMRKIKLAFSKNYRIKAGMKSGRVWQNRYWDHIIRDQNDFNRYIDYIHYNPVKHNLVLDALDYEYSSLSEFMKNGLYPPNWGKKDTLTFDGDFGE
ncbi:MAG: transposase, partial [candidate division Zixibacteria bacterium]|nr:transposase [candidate division Zixibacteria bacterium]